MSGLIGKKVGMTSLFDENGKSKACTVIEAGPCVITQIKEINLKLWNIEDQIRNCESKKDFSQTFIDLARDVYINNDKRSKIKSEINKTLGSNIREIKKYSNY